MKNLKKNLQGVNRELKALVKKVDKMIIAVDKFEKTKAGKKQAPAKKVAVKKPAAKQIARVSASDTVLNIFKRTRKGVDTATLMKKTGFDQKKIFNLIYKLKKEGKIKSIDRGVYLEV